MAGCFFKALDKRFTAKVICIYLIKDNLPFNESRAYSFIISGIDDLVLYSLE